MNGKPLGSVEGWDRGRLFKNLASSLHPGTNLLAIEAENKPAPAANPAGLIARLHLTFADSSTVTLDSDATWRASKTPDPSWNQLSFDQSNWKTAAPVASWGDAPWGKIASQPRAGASGPQSAGIPGSIRFIYVPEPEPVRIKNLEKPASWSAAWFDPVTGATSPLAPAKTTLTELSFAPPPNCSHDWLIILRAAR